MFKKILKGVIGTHAQERQVDLYRNLIRHEAKIGADVFGPVPTGHRREFFCLDEHTWVWHEEWTDKHGLPVVQTTRYDVRPSGVLKSQNGQYQKVSDDEVRRLNRAAKLYVRRVSNQLYAHVS